MYHNPLPQAGIYDTFFMSDTSINTTEFSVSCVPAFRQKFQNNKKKLGGMPLREF